MNERAGQMYSAAIGYYRDGRSMEAVAHELQVSRSTVSRLLAEARATGIVRITVTPPPSSSSAGRAIAQAFGVEVIVVPVPTAAPDTERLAAVGRYAADRLAGHVRERAGQVVGLAWGTTMAEVVRQLTPVPGADATVVQLNGAANGSTSGIPYAGLILTDAGRALGDRVVQFPVPAFFDHPETRGAMWAERSIQRVLRARERVDVAAFGIGAFGGTVASHVYAAGYLDRADLEELRRERVVGDVCTVFLREDGTWRDIPLNARASGLDPEGMAGIPVRLGAVASPVKAPATLGALRAGTMTELVLDEATARAVERLMGAAG